MEYSIDYEIAKMLMRDAEALTEHPLYAQIWADLLEKLEEGQKITFYPLNPKHTDNAQGNTPTST